VKGEGRGSRRDVDGEPNQSNESDDHLAVILATGRRGELWVRK